MGWLTSRHVYSGCSASGRTTRVRTSAVACGSDTSVRWRTRLDGRSPDRIPSSDGLADLGLDCVGLGLLGVGLTRHGLVRAGVDLRY